MIGVYNLKWNIDRTFVVHKIAYIQRLRLQFIDADQEKQFIYANQKKKFIDADQERRICS